MYRQGRETFGGVLGIDEVGQAGESSLGDLVGADSRGGDKSADAGDVDEDLGVACKKEREAGPREKVRAADVDRH